jgi:hypothetical protein
MKIGFLAMSGLRAHDPKLLELGLTLPGVLERGKVLRYLISASTQADRGSASHPVSRAAARWV